MDKEAIIEITLVVAFLIFVFSGTVYAYATGPIPFIP
jgi:hypothetical protein